MRIEVIEQISAYEHKRWEFICKLDSRGLHIRLSSMKLEQRENMSKRSPYHLVLFWADNPAAYQEIPHSLRSHIVPKVPLTIQRIMRKNLEAAIHYNFEICVQGHNLIEGSIAQH